MKTAAGVRRGGRRLRGGTVGVCWESPHPRTEGGHTQCGQATVSGSGWGSQDAPLLSVSIYHKARRLKGNPTSCRPALHTRSERFCRSITNKGNLCTARAGAPEKKTNTANQSRPAADGGRKYIYIKRARCYFPPAAQRRANSSYVLFRLGGAGVAGDDGRPGDTLSPAGRGVKPLAAC